MKIIKNNKGFTLIELIIVIAILGVLLSICVPKNKISDYRLNLQAVTLTNDIRMIRLLMMTEGELHHITLSSKHYTVMNGLNLIKRVELGNNVKVGNNMKSIIKFSYKGSPVQAGSVFMQNTTTGKSYDITIMPYTGRVLLKN